jgi:hypothetical protein
MTYWHAIRGTPSARQARISDFSHSPTRQIKSSGERGRSSILLRGAAMSAIIGTARSSGKDFHLPSSDKFAFLSVLRGFGESVRWLNSKSLISTEPVMRDTTSGDDEEVEQAEVLVNKLSASVAQLVEQLTLNQLVLGSSPSRGTTLTSTYADSSPPPMQPLGIKPSLQRKSG